MKKIIFILATTFASFAVTPATSQSNELIAGIQSLMQKYKEGDYPGVLTLSEKMLVQAEKEFGTNEPLYAVILSIVAASQGEMGKVELAEKNYLVSIAGLKNATGDFESFKGRNYLGLGKVYAQMGYLEKAEENILKAIPIFVRTVGQEGPDYANALNDLGNLYKELGDYAKAEKNLQDAANIRKKVLGEQDAVYGVSLNNLGSLYEQMGDYRRAAVFYEQSRNIWVQSLGQYHPLIATTLNNYAGLFVKVGSYPEAEKFYLQALVVCEKVYGVNHERYVTTLSNLGNLYRSMREFDKAEQFARQCLATRKNTLGEDHIDYAYSLNNLGLIMMDKRLYAEAEKLLTESLEIFRSQLGDTHRNVATCSNNLAMISFKKGDPVRATKFLRQGLGISLERIDYVFPALNDREKTLFYSTLQADFEFFNYFTSQNYKTNPALAGDMYNYCIATKALLLNASNKIKRRILGSGDHTLIALFQEWKSKKNRLAQVWQMTPADKTQNHIDQAALEVEVEELEKKLSAQSELFAAHSDRTRYTWKDIQKKLKPDEAALEIIRFRKFNFEFTDTVYYAALIVRPGLSNPEMVFFEDGNFLEGKLLTGHKNFIKTRLTDEISYPSYWQPLGAKLQGVRKVYLSPDGVYNQINVNGLMNPLTEKYLVEEIEVQQVTNTKDILALPRKPALREAVLIGFPDYKAIPPHEKLRPFSDEENTLSDSVKREMENTVTSLPGTLTEVNIISEIFKSKNIPIQIATGLRASEGFLKKLQSPSVLHIATHGYFLPDVKGALPARSGFMGVDPVKVEENPLLRSGILLAGAQRSISGVRSEGEDGILSAYEATSLNLEETQLIVLSACETGLGEIHNGEGVYGFQRALIIAGAQAIIMSLWKVNDQVTQELMTEFYQFWMGGLPRRQAFIKAQEKIRANHPEPYFWAPFILIGD